MVDVEKTIAEVDAKVKALLCENSRTELDGLLQEANRAINQCVFDHAWIFSIPATLISVPISVRYKTYSPLVMAVVTGGGLDYFRGLQKCQHHQDHIKQIKLAIAIHDHQHDQSPDSSVRPS